MSGQETWTVEQFRNQNGLAKYTDATSKKERKVKATSTLEQKFIDNSGRLPAFEREYEFTTFRPWRIDFAWPAQRVAVEIHGGAWGKGAHNRAKGQENDFTKQNAAVLLGWRYLVFGTEQMKDIGTVIETVIQALGETTCKS